MLYCELAIVDRVEFSKPSWINVLSVPLFLGFQQTFVDQNLLFFILWVAFLPFEVPTHTPSLVQDDIYTSLCLLFWNFHVSVASLYVQTYIWFSPVICFMLIWFLVQLEWSWRGQEILPPQQLHLCKETVNILMALLPHPLLSGVFIVSLTLVLGVMIPTSVFDVVSSVFTVHHMKM